MSADLTPDEVQRWEDMLMVDPGAEGWAELVERRSRETAQALREESDRYARENGYEVDPATGGYLTPERCTACGCLPVAGHEPDDEACQLLQQERAWKRYEDA